MRVTSSRILTAPALSTPDVAAPDAPLPPLPASTHHRPRSSAAALVAFGGGRARWPALLGASFGLACLGLGGCKSDGAPVASQPSPPVQPAPPLAPGISGSPSLSATVGQAYQFQPMATGTAGQALGFGIENKPAWASFDTTTGRLSGTPTEAGTHRDIVISVSDGSQTSRLPAFSIAVTAAGNAPSISGSPALMVVVGQAYQFQPTASDPEGDALRFSILGLPRWATFDPETGRLSGTPTSADVGNYDHIRISVSDGQTSSELPFFGIAVTDLALGSATLTWMRPFENTDGTPLTDLAGFRICHDQTVAPDCSISARIDNPGISSFVVEGLPPGTHAFGVKAFNSAGVESDLSAVATKVID
jgi:hypothetical protein